MASQAGERRRHDSDAVLKLKAGVGRTALSLRAVGEHNVVL